MSGKYRKRRNPWRRAGMTLGAVALGTLLFFMFRTMSAGARSHDTHATEADGSATWKDSLEYVILPPSLSDNELQYSCFKIGFNPDKHIPNYAAWTLTADHTDGPYDRKNRKFLADANVYGSAYPEDYRKSGYDRGHMVPAADMKWTDRGMDECHYLTNICPQDNALNGGAWASLEKMSRKWAVKMGRIVIVCGPVLTDRITRTIGRHEVAVPDRFFKVILAPDNHPPMGIGFIMPNKAVQGGVQQSAMSIDQVEAITGFDFFPALPDDIESAVEAQNAFNQWNRY